MRKGEFPFFTSEIIGNCSFPLSFHGKNSHEILLKKVSYKAVMKKASYKEYV